MLTASPSIMSANSPVHCIAAGASLLAGLFAETLMPDLPGVFALASACLLFSLLTVGARDRISPIAAVAALALVGIFVPEIRAQTALADIPVVRWSVAGIVAFAALGLIARRLEYGLSVRQLRGAYANSPTPHLLTDRFGNVRCANAACLRLLGVDGGNPVGTNIRALLPAHLWKQLAEPYALPTEGEPVHLVCDVAPDPEHPVWVSVYACRLNAELILTQFVDLSRAIASKHALSAAQNRFEGMFEQSDAMNFILDADGRLLEFNSAASRRFGPRLDDLVGSPADLLVDADCLARFREELLAARTAASSGRLIDQCHLKIGDKRCVVEVRISHLPRAHEQDDAMLVSCREIADQLRSLAQLQMSEARFSRIFHASPDAIVIIRQVDGVIVDFNEGFTRTLGYTREEAIGRPESQFGFWSSEHTQRRQILEILEESGECMNQETSLRAKSGAPVRIMLSLRYIEIDGDICVLAIGRDITKRVMAEQARRVSEEKFAQVFSRSPDGIAILDADDGHIYDLNDAFLNMLDYDSPTLVGRSIDEVSLFELPDQLAAIRAQIADSGEFHNVELSLRSRHGESVPALASGSMISLGPRQCILCIVKDIGDQRRAEARLRASEERFRGAFLNAPIGMLFVDPHGRVSHANHFAIELLDWRDGQIDGVDLRDLVPRDERGEVDELLRKLDGSTTDTAQREVRMLCQTGREIATNFHVVVQRRVDGGPAGYMIQIADITESKQSQARMEKLAFYDTLTNLANRRLFNERLTHTVEHARRNNAYAALLYLDLDQFKRVNDTLGHEAGDELLCQVAARLQTCVRKEDTVARPGGDEFTILLNNIASTADAGIVADKILRKLRAPVLISGHNLVVTTSIGITLIPTDGSEPDVLTKNADLAMYKAKERGRNNYQYFSEEMNTSALLRLRTEHELRRALERQQFVLMYQPKIRLADQQLVGVECLLRWQHPERGLLDPCDFLEVAEETGTIVEIGNWIVHQACLAARELSDHSGRQIDVAVNLSTAQFREPLLSATVARALRETRLRPSQLSFEVTEPMLMQDPDTAALIVGDLHDLGVGLAIDDFGTGYSSLNYLKRFPIDTVKIDGSFIADIPANPDDKAITAAVIAMAHELRLDVVAEGVETAEQLDFLAAQGCDHAQGYLFSRPVELDHLKSTVVQKARIIPMFPTG